MNKFNQDVCKRHSCRAEKDKSRICPSKLSKIELEELYFTVLDNNTDLKKTVNTQTDKLKNLSTKLIRANNSQVKRQLCKSQSKCCANSQAVIEEQKNLIEELQQGNNRLKEKNHQLNMRLCTQKQFMRVSPNRVFSKNRAPSVGASSRKSQDGVESDTNVASTMVTDRSQKSADDEEKTVVENPGKVNEITETRNEITELKERIQDLQEELKAARMEYSVRLQTLEAETIRVQAEARGRLREYTQQRQQLTSQLRRAHSSTSSLTTELFIEKKKVTELRAQVRAATLAQEVLKMLEDHLIHASSKSENDLSPIREPKNIDPKSTKSATNEFQDQQEQPEFTSSEALTNYYLHPTNNDTKGLLEIIKQLMKKISCLQSELDALKISQTYRTMHTNETTSTRRKSREGSIVLEKNTDGNGLTSAPTELLGSGASPAFVPDTLSVRAPDCLCSLDDICSPDAQFQQPSTSSNIGKPSMMDDRISSQDESPSKGRLLKVFNRRSSSKQMLYSEPTVEITCSKQDVSTESTNNANGYEYANDVDCECPEVGSQLPCPGSFVGCSSAVSEKKSFDKSPSHRILKVFKRPSILKPTLDQNQSFEIKTQSLSNADQTHVDDCECVPEVYCECPSEAQQPSSSSHVESWMAVGEKKSKNESSSQRKLQNLSSKPSVSKKTSEPRQSRATLETDVKTNDMSNADDHTLVNEECEATDCECPAYALPTLPSTSSYLASWPSAGDRKRKEESPSQRKLLKLHNKPSVHSKTSEPKTALETEQDEDTRILCSCSGSAKFKTVSLYKNKLKSCVCKPIYPKRIRKMTQAITCMTLETVKDSVPRKKSESSVGSDKTYTVNGDGAEGSTANNTDKDAASIPDKSDKDATSSTRAEDNPKLDVSEYTTTEPTSYSETVDTSGNTFSDGEIPATSRLRACSDTRTTRPNTETSLNVPSNADSTSLKVAEALRAISHELCKCRELLESQQQPQINEGFSARDVDYQPDTKHELRKTAASPKIPETPEHLCSFTVHVGSVVLSDEAVFLTKKKDLFLQWRFYDQNYTITPIRPGRVMHFNFSTQYVVTVTPRFLQYLTNNEMLMSICEIGQLTEPYANCSFPLRSVLANPCRRVDVSVALVAPPLAGATCSCEEVGVLDLWCLLQFDADSAPLLEEAQAQASREGAATGVHSEKNNTISIMEKIAEEQADNQEASSDNKEVKKYSDDNEKIAVDTIEIPPGSVGGTTSEAISYVPMMEVNTSIDAASSDLKKPQFNKPEELRSLDVDSNIDNRCSLTNSVDELNLSPSQPQAAVKSERPDHMTSSGGTQRIAARGPGKSDGQKKMVKINHPKASSSRVKDDRKSSERRRDGTEAQCVDITVLWLALNEECAAMHDVCVTQLYVAYAFLGRCGADLETPMSVPKPSHYAEKVHFNFMKTFYLQEDEQRALAHMASCCSPPPPRRGGPPENAIVFTVVSEPAEDPLGLDNCEDIGHAYLFLGDLLIYTSGDSYTEVVAVYPGSVPCAANAVGDSSKAGAACGVLSVRVDGLEVVRQCAVREGYHIAPSDAREYLL